MTTVALINPNTSEAIIVGGGPLGRAARRLRATLDVPVIEPIPEAVRRIARALGDPATACG